MEEDLLAWLALAALVALAVLLVTAFAIVKWSRWLGGRYGAPRWVRWVGPIGLVLWAPQPLFGAVRTILYVEATNGGSAADRQQRLSYGSAELLYATLFYGVLIEVILVILLVALTWKYHWAAKAPTAKGLPPYR